MFRNLGFCLAFAVTFIFGCSSKAPVTTNEPIQVSKAAAPLKALPDPQGLVTQVITATIDHSHYPIWEAIQYADEMGILDEEGKKLGVEFKVDEVTYPVAVTNYSGTGLDGTEMVVMDGIMTPAVQGKRTSVIAVTSRSVGNDKVIVHKDRIKSVEDLRGKKIGVEMGLVPHFLALQMLKQHGMTEQDVQLVAVAEDAVIGAYKAGEIDAIACYNPNATTLMKEPDAAAIFTSAEIPFLIVDSIVWSTDQLEKDPRPAIALLRALYRVLPMMRDGHEKQEEVFTRMAEQEGANVADFRSMMDTTAGYYTPEDSLAFMSGDELKESIKESIRFSFDQVIYGEGESINFIGVRFPDGTIYGDPENVQLIVDPRPLEYVISGQK